MYEKICTKCGSDDLSLETLKETGEIFCLSCKNRWYDPFFLCSNEISCDDPEETISEEEWGSILEQEDECDNRDDYE